MWGTSSLPVHHLPRCGFQLHGWWGLGLMQLQAPRRPMLPCTSEPSLTITTCFGRHRFACWCKKFSVAYGKSYKRYVICVSPT